MHAPIETRGQYQGAVRLEVVRSGPAVAAESEFIALYHARFTDPSGQILAFIGSRPMTAWVSIPDGHTVRVGPVSPDGRVVPVTYMAADVPAIDIGSTTSAVSRWGTFSGVSLGNIQRCLAGEHVAGNPGDPDLDPDLGLRVTHVTWAGDGRLVMLMSLDRAGYVVTWTEDVGYQAVPFDWPGLDLSVPLNHEILVLEP